MRAAYKLTVTATPFCTYMGFIAYDVFNTRCAPRMTSVVRGQLTDQWYAIIEQWAESSKVNCKTAPCSCGINEYLSWGRYFKTVIRRIVYWCLSPLWNKSVVSKKNKNWKRLILIVKNSQSAFLYAKLQTKSGGRAWYHKHFTWWRQPFEIGLFVAVNVRTWVLVTVVGLRDIRRLDGQIIFKTIGILEMAALHDSF